MKKNLKFIQTTILYEVMKVYNTRDLADMMIDILNKNDVELSVYETHSDGMIFRKKRDGTITDTDIIGCITKAIRKLIKKTKDKDNDIAAEIDDNYEFEYDDKYITDSFFDDIIQIRRAGRLIYIEIDL